MLAVFTHKALGIRDKGLEGLLDHFKAVRPRLREPTHAIIEIAPSDVLQRTKSKGAFCGRNEFNMMFASSSKIPRRVFSRLTGDPFFNRWPIKAIPFGQLVRCTTSTLDKMFKTFTPADTDGRPEDDDTAPMAMDADEMSLKDDEVIPFPDEVHYNMGAEMMHIFGSEIMVLLHGGSGQLIKGVLSAHLHAVVVVRSREQKKLIERELTKWVKHMNVVRFADKPKKPDCVLQYLLQMVYWKLECEMHYDIKVTSM